MDRPASLWIMSAYRSESHASWARWLEREAMECNLNFRLFELPGRYFRWRIRGNPLSWLAEVQDALTTEVPDHILATSMVDISTLKGLHPSLAHVPVTLYFHENQFAYPVGEGQHSSIDPQMVQLYGALSANECWFNSSYNRDSFLQGMDALLRKMPDHVPDNIVERIADKCRIVPVPVDPLERRQGASSRPLILWNHRWEYDKRPDRFLELLDRLESDGVEFELALLGPRAQKVPKALLDIRSRHASRIIADGMVPRAEYEALLRSARVVISTADHEFQGLAMIEAVSAGASPVVPDALCYREQYPEQHRYPSGDMSAAAALVKKALDACEQVNQGEVDISDWTSDKTAPIWRAFLQDKAQPQPTAE